MKKNIVLFMISLFLGTSYLLGATLTIEISNIQSQKGTLHVGIYTKNQEFPNKEAPFMSKELKPKSQTGQVEATFDNLEEGTYAVAIYHDINRNGMLDTNFIGMPTEPYGFSNNFKPKFSKPKFSDCSFSIEKEGREITIGLVD